MRCIYKIYSKVAYFKVAHGFVHNLLSERVWSAYYRVPCDAFLSWTVFFFFTTTHLRLIMELQTPCVTDSQNDSRDLFWTRNQRIFFVRHLLYLFYHFQSLQLVAFIPVGWPCYYVIVYLWSVCMVSNMRVKYGKLDDWNYSGVRMWPDFGFKHFKRRLFPLLSGWAEISRVHTMAACNKVQPHPCNRVWLWQAPA